MSIGGGRLIAFARPAAGSAYAALLERDGTIPEKRAGRGQLPRLIRRENTEEANGAGGGTRTPTGFRPTDFRTLYGFRRDPPSAKARLWGLDYPFALAAVGGRLRRCPSSLYTFPAGRFRPGLARDCHFTGSPEFGQFYVAGFPARTQVVASSPLRLPIPPRPPRQLSLAAFHGRAKRILFV